MGPGCGASCLAVYQGTCLQAAFVEMSRSDPHLET